MSTSSLQEETRPLLINTSQEEEEREREREKGKEREREREEEDRQKKRLTRSQILLFSSLQSGVSFSFGVTGSWLSFHYLPPADSGHPQLIDAAVFSLTLLFGRILNGLLEPWIGYFSDHCTSRFGRRAPFIFAAAPLHGLTFALFWFMPFEPLSWEASLWFITLFLLNNFFGACIMAPYISLLPEISQNPAERVSLSVAMGVWGLIGNLVVALVGPLDVWIGEEGVELLGYSFSGLQLLCCIMAAVMTFFCWISLLAVKEEPLGEHQISEFSLLGEMRTAFSNPAFRTFIGFQSLFICTLTMWQAAFPFLCTVVLETEGGIVQPSQGETWVGIFGLITIGGALLSTPFVSRVTKRLGKKRLLLGSAVISIVGVMLTFGIQYLRDPGLGFLLIMICVSFPLGVLLIIPNAIFADVVELDERQTGKRREGVYTGVRLLINRVVGGVGSFLFIPILMVGDTKEDPLGIMLVFLVAGSIFTVATLIFSRHPISH